MAKTDLLVFGCEDETAAETEKKKLEIRGFTVKFYGPADYITVNTEALGGGGTATGKNGWLVVGLKGLST